MNKSKFAAFIFVFGPFIVAAGCADQTTVNDANSVRNTSATRNMNAATNMNAPSNTNQMTNANSATDVKVADLTGRTADYVGKTVTVEGWVERTYGANSFRLDEDSVFTGGIDNDLLVVGKAGVIPTGLKFGDADAKARVTGTVRRVVIAEIERELGIDLQPEIETEFRDKAVLVANSIQVVERDE